MLAKIESEKIKYDVKGPFVQSPCPHKQKWQELSGKEHLIKCGSYYCRICKYHSPIQGHLEAFYCFHNHLKN